MATDLAALFGTTLLSGDASIATADVLLGKTSVLIYFSAHWCPPCRGFTPVLTEAYKEYKAIGGNETEVVFVSRDQDVAAFKGYFEEMPWLAVPFEDTQEIRDGLGKKFEVNGIPALVAIGPDGTKIFDDDSVDIRTLVTKHKGAAFPVTPTQVKSLAAEQERLAKDNVKELRSIFPTLRARGGEEVSFGELFDTHDHVVLLLGDGDSSDATYQAVSKTESAVNDSAEGSKRLAVVYLGWTLYDPDSCDHAPFKEKYYTVQESAQVLAEEFKTKLKSLVANQLGPPHALVIGRDEGGFPAVVADDAGCGSIRTYEADGYPWSKSRVAELEAVKKTRIAELKKNQTNLQFLKGEGRDGLFANDGKEVKVDTLANGESTGVVALYFSGHWCPPCRGFTPVLAKCYNELKASGKSFEVIFLSSDKDDGSFKEYFAEMPWLSVPFSERNLKGELSDLFEVQGIPALVLLKPDGTLLMNNGREAVSYGADYFPWGPYEMARGKEEGEKKAAEQKEAAIKAEASALEQQKADGQPVVKRLRGEPGDSFEHDVAAHTIKLNSFPTFGAPELITKAGVLYYEIEVLESSGIPQVGFVSGDFAPCDQYSGNGVGDDDASWGFDGVRQCRWYDGNSGWPCTWKTGDIVGFAANVDNGKIAVAKNGDWAEPNGVVFDNEKIKSGVYPAFTGSGYNLRYNLDGSRHGPFTHAPPPDALWLNSPQ